MDTAVVIAVAVIAVLVIALIALLVVRGTGGARRSRRLKERFGPEYDRVVTDTGDERRAEEVLAAREEHRDSFDIRPLDAAARERYLSGWRAAQRDFVDRPDQAVATADRLVKAVMQERGYPVEDFDQRAADLSVDHPDVVDNYRAANAIAAANAQGSATTEELRQAMRHYRSLFERLLDIQPDGRTTDKEAR